MFSLTNTKLGGLALNRNEWYFEIPGKAVKNCLSYCSIVKESFPLSKSTPLFVEEEWSKTCLSSAMLSQSVRRNSFFAHAKPASILNTLYNRLVI